MISYVVRSTPEPSPSTAIRLTTAPPLRQPEARSSEERGAAVSTFALPEVRSVSTLPATSVDRYRIDSPLPSTGLLAGSYVFVAPGAPDASTISYVVLATPEPPASVADNVTVTADFRQPDGTSSLVDGAVRSVLTVKLRSCPTGNGCPAYVTPNVDVWPSVVGTPEISPSD